MTKLEYIARYGEEGWKKRLESSRKCFKSHRAQHLETCRNWRLRHPDYDSEYQKEHRSIYHKNLGRSRPYMKRYKATHKHCEICGAPTADAHHIVPIPNDRLLDFNDPILLDGNLMAVCDKCHDKLHNELRNGE